MSEHADACVLVVDDDPDIGEAIDALLGVYGYPVATAQNGKEALRWLRCHTKPRLILLDLMMPGMDGFEFRARQLRDRDLASIPVVVMTGAGPIRIEEKKAELEAEILHKPIGLDRLLAVVRRFAGEAPPEGDGSK